MLLYFIRHGDPCYDPDSLTALGHRQAEAIGRRLAAYGVDRIFSSPMNRAMQTAQPTAEITGKVIAPLDFASEVHAWDALTLRYEDGRRAWACSQPEIQALFASPEVRAMGMNWHAHPAFEGTRFTAYMEYLGKESAAWLASLGYERLDTPGMYRAVKENDERVALFAHAGFGTAFMSELLGIPYPQYSQTFDLCHSSLTVIEFKQRNGLCIPSVLTMSNDAHLYRDRLPVNERAKF